MNVLVIGGSGMVGSHTVPHLAGSHRVRVLDRRPVSADGVEWLEGDARSADDVARGVDGVDGVVHMAAVVPRAEQYDPATVHAAYEVNVASLHLAMSLAAAAGVRAFVHISTMSVFRRYGTDVIDPLAATPDAVQPYGLTKRLGEQVVRALAPELGITACSLRLIYPTPDADWPLWRAPEGTPPRPMTMRDGRTPIATLATSDLAGAIDCALAYTGPYRAFTATADVAGTSVVPDDTQHVLGWKPARVLAPE
ncbi:NAD-dependent epimerase/dehydratase family protein [Jiangella gansuensis]|uniref:NAD-dependent epimerase/dehydratase family protein n=1 Tax=Jiangella gansuensis TaxID=281473 RepID=UPI00047A89D1|nr:NAD(P)-dependent oxidoreductase [Jiangella gansuensis]